MQAKRPSPALVVSIVALVVAMSGTAVAAKMLITSSSQIKNGSIRGIDLKNGTITKSKLAGSALDAISASDVQPAAGGSTAALEAHRLKGPDLPRGEESTVLELPLQPGVYAVFAKATVSPDRADNGLLQTLFREGRTVGGECRLDVAGTGDYAINAIAGFGSENPATLNLQATRTLDRPGTAVLKCGTSVPIHAAVADASIIAMKVGSSSRTEAAR